MRAPPVKPGPEPLHVVAVGVDPVRAGDLFLIALRGDRRARPQGPDVLAKGMTTQASVRHHPFRHPGQALQERDGLREFMRLTRRRNERHRPPEPVGDHARLGPIAPTRTAPPTPTTRTAQPNGPTLHDDPAALKSPFSSGTGCFLM